MKGFNPFARLFRACAIACSVSILAACSQGVLDPKGPVGKAERLMLLDATAIMLAIVIPVIIATLLFAWWFRSSNPKAKYRPTWNYSGRLEMIVWSIPALVVLFLGGIAWIGSHQLHPASPLSHNGADTTAPINVDVISLDWKWLFIYPDEGVATVNRLVIPTGRQVRFRLTSTSVMNSFFVPQLGSQIYTMPGMTTKLFLQADHPGTYKGISAQFSGEGFSDMHFTVSAVDGAEFASWVQTNRTTAAPLNAQLLTTLFTPSVADAPQTFAATDVGLFDRLVASVMERPDAAGLELANAMCTTPSAPAPLPSALLSVKDR